MKQDASMPYFEPESPYVQLSFEGKCVTTKQLPKHFMGREPMRLIALHCTFMNRTTALSENLFSSCLGCDE